MQKWMDKARGIHVDKSSAEEVEGELRTLVEQYEEILQKKNGLLCSYQLPCTGTEIRNQSTCGKIP